MVNRFRDIGCTVLTVEGPRESQGDSRVLRNVEDPLQSEIWLKVAARMDQKPFILGRLLGSGESGEFVIRVAGRELSERVSP